MTNPFYLRNLNEAISSCIAWPCAILPPPNLSSLLHALAWMGDAELVLAVVPCLIHLLLFALYAQLLDMKGEDLGAKLLHLELRVVNLYVNGLFLLIELLVLEHLIVVHLLHLGIKFNLCHRVKWNKRFIIGLECTVHQQVVHQHENVHTGEVVTLLHIDLLTL